MAAAKQLQGLSSVLGLIQGLTGQSGTGTQTTTGSQTTKSDMTKEGMDRVLQQILAGPGGVKDISGAARGAGLYNSSTEAQLLNDLSARAAGELEKQRAGTTTNSNQTTVSEQAVPGMSLGGLIKPLALMTAAKPVLGGIGSLLDGKGFLEGTGLSGIFGGAGNATAENLTASLAPDLSNLVTGPALSSSMGGTLGNLGSGILNLTNEAAGGIGSLLAAPSIDLGAQLGTEIGFTPTFSAALNGGVPGIGSFLGGLLGGGAPEDIGGFGLGTSALAGAAFGGPVGLLAAPLAGVLGSALGDISIICTALTYRGLLDKDEYFKGHEYLQSVNYYTKQGYYYLCKDVAAKISNGDSFWTAVCLPFARSRTKLIAQGKGWKRWVRYPLGTLTKLVGEPICWCVGKYKLAHSGPVKFSVR